MSTIIDKQRRTNWPVKTSTNVLKTEGRFRATYELRTFTCIDKVHDVPFDCILLVTGYIKPI